MIKNDKMRRGAAKNGQDKNLFVEETSKYQRMSEPDSRKPRKSIPGQ